MSKAKQQFKNVPPPEGAKPASPYAGYPQQAGCPSFPGQQYPGQPYPGSYAGYPGEPYPGDQYAGEHAYAQHARYGAQYGVPGYPPPPPYGAPGYEPPTIAVGAEAGDTASPLRGTRPVTEPVVDAGTGSHRAVPDPGAERAADLVKRQFTAGAPNRLWVADFTYVATWAGTVYTAFAVDAFSRKIVGWKTSRSKETDLVLEAYS